jgi:GxxExxY protein
MKFHELLDRDEVKADPRTEELASLVIGAAIEVHRHLGPGLAEKTYRNALVHELRLRGVECQPEVHVPIYYKGKLVREGFVDVLVERVLVVEVKVVENLIAVHRAQTISYLQALKLQLGLMLNFNVAAMKDGIKRVINTF